jgi:hypothetical protein
MRKSPQSILPKEENRLGFAFTRILPSQIWNIPIIKTSIVCRRPNVLNRKDTQVKCGNYLVDSTGNSIDPDGNKVSFEDRYIIGMQADTGICAVYGTFSTPSNCEFMDNGFASFYSGNGECIQSTQEDVLGNLCYHVSTDASRMFMS